MRRGGSFSHPSGSSAFNTAHPCIKHKPAGCPVNLPPAHGTRQPPFRPPLSLLHSLSSSAKEDSLFTLTPWTPPPRTRQPPMPRRPGGVSCLLPPPFDRSVHSVPRPLAREIWPCYFTGPALYPPFANCFAEIRLAEQLTLALIS